MATATIDLKFKTPSEADIKRPFEAAIKGAKETVSSQSVLVKSLNSSGQAVKHLVQDFNESDEVQAALSVRTLGLSTPFHSLSKAVAGTRTDLTKMTDEQKRLDIQMRNQSNELKHAARGWYKAAGAVAELGSTILETGYAMAKMAGLAALAGVALTGLAVGGGAYKLNKWLSQTGDLADELGDTFTSLSDRVGGTKEDWRQFTVQLALSSAIEIEDATKIVREMAFYIQRSGLTMEEAGTFLTNLTRGFQLYEATSEQTTKATIALSDSLEGNKVSMTLVRELYESSPLIFENLAQATINAGHSLDNYGKNSHLTALELGKLADEGKLGTEVMIEFNKIMLEAEEINKRWDKEARPWEQRFNRMGTVIQEWKEQAYLLPLPFLLFGKKFFLYAVLATALFYTLEGATGAWMDASAEGEAARLKFMSSINKEIDILLHKGAKQIGQEELLMKVANIRYTSEAKTATIARRNRLLQDHASEALRKDMELEAELYKKRHAELIKLESALKNNQLNAAEGHKIQILRTQDELKTVSLRILKAQELQGLLDDHAKRKAEQAREANGQTEKQIEKQEEANEALREEIKQREIKNKGILQSAANFLFPTAHAQAYNSELEKVDGAIQSQINATADLRDIESQLEENRKHGAKLSKEDQKEILGLVNQLIAADKERNVTVEERFKQVKYGGELEGKNNKDLIVDVKEILKLTEKRIDSANELAAVEHKADKDRKERLKIETDLVKRTASAYISKYGELIKYSDIVELTKTAESDLERRIWENIGYTIKAREHSAKVVELLGRKTESVSTAVRDHEEKLRNEVEKTTDAYEDQGEKAVKAKDKIKKATNEVAKAEREKQKAIKESAKVALDSAKAIYKAEAKNVEIIYEGIDARTKAWVEEHNRAVRKRKEEEKLAEEKAEAEKKRIEEEAEAKREAERLEEEAANELERIEEENHQRSLERVEALKQAEFEYYTKVSKKAKEYGIIRRGAHKDDPSDLESLESWERRIEQKRRHEEESKKQKRTSNLPSVPYFDAPIGYFMGVDNHKERAAMGLIEKIAFDVAKGATVSALKQSYERKTYLSSKGISVGDKGVAIGQVGSRGVFWNTLPWGSMLPKWFEEPAIASAAKEYLLSSSNPDVTHLSRVRKDGGIYAISSGDFGEAVLGKTESVAGNLFREYLDKIKSTLPENIINQALKYGEGGITPDEETRVKKSIAEFLTEGLPSTPYAEVFKPALEKIMNAPNGLLEMLTQQAFGIVEIRRRISEEKQMRGEGRSATKQEALDIISKAGATGQAWGETYEAQESAIGEYVSGLARKPDVDITGSGTRGTGGTEQSLNEQQSRQISLLENQLSLRDSFSRSIARQISPIGRLPMHTGESTFAPPMGGTEMPLAPAETQVSQGLQQGVQAAGAPPSAATQAPIEVKVMIDPAEITKKGLESKDTEVENAALNSGSSQRSNRVVDYSALAGSVTVTPHQSGGGGGGNPIFWHQSSG